MSLPTLNDDNKKNNSQMSLPSFDMPPIDSEDEFESLPVNDALYKNTDEDDNEEIYDEVENEVNEPELPRVEENEDMLLQSENDYNPDFEEDLEKEEEEKSKFIDKEKKKIIPFGGKKSKKKLVKSSDFDDRKNKLAKTKIIQFSILSVIFILFLLGLKNTFLPSHVYTSDQIKQFAAEGAGQTGFPSERGEAYVESFMEIYLTLDRTRGDLLDMLGHFYGEDRINNSTYSGLNMKWNSQSKQDIIIPPKVFEVNLLTPYSAQYKVSAFVSNTDGETIAGNESAGRWVSFSVNVYHDNKTDALVITPDSPSIIPSYKIAKQTVVPQRYPLGNGTVNKEIEPALTPTINGFIEAFAKSSLESHESIVQYIDDKSNVSLTNGFGGSVKLNGSPANAIKKVIYNGDDGIYRVDVTVNWIDNAASGGENQVEYTSRYIMRVVPIANGKYAVSSFVPYTYYK